MRLIGRTLKSTSLKWLSIISNIHPPKIRREQSFIRESTKCTSNPNLPIHLRSFNDRPKLKSRKLPRLTAKELK